MKNNSTPAEETFTPRGLTSNWNFLGHYTPAGKRRAGGEFVSRLEHATARRIRRETARAEILDRKVDSTRTDIPFQQNADGSISWVGPRKKGKFPKKHSLSATLAAKLGLVPNN
jgi:hypothetical protein